MALSEYDQNQLNRALADARAAEAVSSLNRFTSSKARMSEKESRSTIRVLLTTGLSLMHRMTAECLLSLSAEPAT